MAKNNKMPVIRFSGYTNVWEQYKLSDITEVIMGQSPSSKNYTDNPNDDILVQGNADLKDGKVVPRLWTKEITKTIDKGGIILTVRAPVGDVAKTDYKVVLGRGVAGIKGNDYIYQFLQKLQYNRYWVSLSSGSTFESINSNDIKDLIIDIPSIEEQTKISMLLNNVNSIITLHQRKLEKLKLTKKALLQKLFPKNGSNIPELRFKGFTNAWEQRKLESLFTKYEDKVNTPSSGYWRLGLRSHCKGTFHTYIDAGNELETAEMNRVKSGNFILNITFAWERALAVTNDEDQDKLVSHRFPQFKPNNDLVIDFFKHTLMDKRFKHHLELSSPGGAGRNKVLKVADMLKYELLVPSIKEQNEISSFLNHVDYIITLHQRKLEMLKNVKKGLLQKTFV